MTLTYWPLAALCGLLLATHAQAIEGQKIYTQGGAAPAVTACSSCHGADGMGMAAGGFPRLAGLSAEYLTKQIKDYRSGSRANPIMQPIAVALSDDELTAVTEMLAGMPAPEVERFSRSAEAEGMGAVLALRGAWERNIPACVACHGPSGVGVGSAFPPLVGQSSQYLTAQLEAWRQGTRQNDPNDLMGHIARSMTDAEIAAVSRYFASLSQ